jgi:hypothetical protein
MRRTMSGEIWSLAVPAHVTDGIERIDDPEAAGDEGEQRAERLKLERKGQAGNSLADIKFRTLAVCDHDRQLNDDREQQD